jgi:hypothetical protein
MAHRSAVDGKPATTGARRAFDRITRARYGPDGVLPCAAPTYAQVRPRWIKVSLIEQTIHLCEGHRVMREYRAATGLGDTPDHTTHPGLFAVYEKSAGPFLLPEYDVYVSHWVAFDPAHDNGFRSQPMTEQGIVVDAWLGQAVSHGCIRTAQPAEIFRFAEFDMSVWVH